MKFVCKPGARNITVIFQPLLRYCTLSATHFKHLHEKLHLNLVSRFILGYWECDQQRKAARHQDTANYTTVQLVGGHVEARVKTGDCQM